MPAILTRENDAVRIILNDDCSGTITDKTTETSWTIHPLALQEDGPIMTDVVWNRSERSFCDYYPGYFKAVAQGEDLRITVRQPLGKEMGSFTCKITLDGPWIEFRLEDLDASLPSLVFPPHLHSESLILPNGIGKWMKEPLGVAEFWTQATHLNMRWMGGLKADEEHGWMAIYGDQYADSGMYLHQMAAAPTWLKTLGKWAPTRSIRYRCTTGGYVGMAKTFREYAKANGMFRSLKEKIEEVPAVGDLLGGRIVSFFMGSTVHKENPLEDLQTLPEDVAARDGQMDVIMNYADAAQIIKEAKDLGMKKGVFNLRGVFRGGYDEYHPDIWPPEKAYGSVDELKALLADPAPYCALMHDNYQDAYPRAESFPDGVIHNEKGELMPGGYWHGGQCYIMNPRSALKYVKRNWEQIKTLAPRGAFVDTMACVQFYQDYNPEALLERTQDWQSKVEIMKFFKSQKIFLGSENASDFGMSYIDFLENRHEHVPGVSIPLWPLVYHDAAYCGRYGGGGTSGCEASRDLEDYLWGYAKLWPAGSVKIWSEMKEAFKGSLPLDDWHARIGTDEMVTHEYLCEDKMVERAEFSSGVSLLANFADEPRTVDGKTVGAGEHMILE